MKPDRRQRLSHLLSLAIVLLFLLCVCLLLYPYLRELHDRWEVKKEIVSYDTSVNHMDPAEKAQILAAARDYNQSLLEHPIGFDLNEDQMARYQSLLDPLGTGVMGYLTIPCIKVSLMIYHTTEEPVLQTAVGHLPGSSLPVGGAGTHTILTGHTGLPTPLLTNLDKVQVGDKFYLNILEDILAYEVDDIRVVLPQEMAGLLPEAGKDYCTLVTCTPFGVNSHRLLVRGHRTEAPPKAAEGGPGSYETSDMVGRDISHLSLIYALCGLALLSAGLTYLVLRRRRKRRTEG